MRNCQQRGAKKVQDPRRIVWMKVRKIVRQKYCSDRDTESRDKKIFTGS